MTITGEAPVQGVGQARDQREGEGDSGTGGWVNAMPIVQINVWICEVCRFTATVVEKPAPYSDPVVGPPNDSQWGYVGEAPNEKLACPQCMHKDTRKKVAL